MKFILAALCLVVGTVSWAADPVPGWLCSKWPDGTYYLYCGTAYIGHYQTARECVAGKRATCD